jgi:AcrR family transcriptional regulator
MAGIRVKGRGGGREGRRQRRIARRRSEILAAAARVFARQGYTNATMREIADEADMAEGTLYNYFDGKREILLAIASEAEAPMEAALLEAGTMESREEMVAMAEKALDISGTRLPFTRTLLTEAWLDDDILQGFVVVRLNRVHQHLVNFIEERIAAGMFRSIDSTLAAQIIIGMFGGLMLPALRGVAPPPSVERCRALAETVVDLLLDGVRA